VNWWWMTAIVTTALVAGMAVGRWLLLS